MAFYNVLVHRHNSKNRPHSQYPSSLLFHHYFILCGTTSRMETWKWGYRITVCIVRLQISVSCSRTRRNRSAPQVQGAARKMVTSTKSIPDNTCTAPLYQTRDITNSPVYQAVVRRNENRNRRDTAAQLSLEQGGMVTGTPNSVLTEQGYSIVGPMAPHRQSVVEGGYVDLEQHNTPFPSKVPLPVNRHSTNNPQDRNITALSPDIGATPSNNGYLELISNISTTATSISDNTAGYPYSYVNLSTGDTSTRPGLSKPATWSSGSLNNAPPTIISSHSANKCDYTKQFTVHNCIAQGINAPLIAQMHFCICLHIDTFFVNVPCTHVCIASPTLKVYITMWVLSPQKCPHIRLSHFSLHTYHHY